MNKKHMAKAGPPILRIKFFGVCCFGLVPQELMLEYCKGLNNYQYYGPICLIL